MEKQREVFQFINQCMKQYSLSLDFFLDTDECVPSYSEVLATAAKVLGVSKTALTRMDYDTVLHWYHQYPFFKLEAEYLDAYRLHYRENGGGQISEAELISCQPSGALCSEKYGESAIKLRMIDLLKEMDQSMPGAYHPNGTIEKLQIFTESFFHFSKIDRLVSSYLELVARFESLFFTAFSRTLSPSEVKEYNFLVSTIGIEDRCFTREYLFYDLLCTFMPVYKQEGYTDFLSYVRIPHYRVLHPWYCAEFSLNKSIAQDFVNIYPTAKQEIREFAQNVSTYKCCFTWSDSVSSISEMELNEINDVAIALGEPTVTLENCPPMPSLVRVPKTKNELNGDDTFARKLRILSGPASLGGIIAPSPEFQTTAENTIQRLMARLNAKKKIPGDVCR